MVEVFLNNESLELENDIDLTYTLQVNDIRDVATRQASYTNSLKVPPTPKNTQILRGLGMVGDTSRVPYQKPTCQIIDDGFALISDGWAVIKNTDDNYNLPIYNGIINFFKAIENKTLGIDLDLSLINHNKTVASVLNSFTAGLPYRYLLADYNGRTHFDTDNKILIDYLPPSASVKYLWDLIFSTFGFTYSGAIFATAEFNDLWLTYPKGVEGNVSTTLILESSDMILNSEKLNILTTTTNTNEITYNQNIFTSTINGTLKISITAFLDYCYFDDFNNITKCSQPYIISLYKNNVFFGYLYHPAYSSTFIDLNIPVDVNDFFYIEGESIGQGNFSSSSWQNLKISKYDTLQSFSEELKEFKITDFVKEILNKYCLTMFTDNHSKNIHFMNIKERIETENIIDWTNKYVERTNETYIFDSYAQKNTFEYQYNDKEDAHNDGSISINNVNLNALSSVWKSVTYSPLKELNSLFFIGSSYVFASKIFKQYDKEIKESNTGGVQEIKYKPLSKRFYFLHSNLHNASAIFGSQQLSNSQAFTGNIPIANFNQLDMNSIIGANYLPMQTILNDSRLHTIKLALSKFDIMNLDFKTLYYFEQEQQYYLLNKINFKNGQISTGEFVRVKYEKKYIIKIKSVATSLCDIETTFETNIPIGQTLNITIKPTGNQTDPNFYFNYNILVTGTNIDLKSLIYGGEYSIQIKYNNSESNIFIFNNTATCNN